VGSARIKLIVLGALAVVWGALLVGRGLLPGDRPAAAPAETKEAAPRVAPKPAVAHLKRELIEAERPPYPPEGQSLFGAPPPPPPLPRTATAAPNGGPGAPPAQPPVPPPDPFQEGAKQLKYLGFLRSGGAATAFITQGSDLYTVVTGEVIAGRFRVVEVQDDAVVLASPAGDKQVRVLLVPEAAAGAVGARPPVPPPGR
jgi:hypothetical protein